MKIIWHTETTELACIYEYVSLQLRYHSLFCFAWCLFVPPSPPPNCCNFRRSSHSSHPSFFKMSGSNLWLASIWTPLLWHFCQNTLLFTWKLLVKKQTNKHPQHPPPLPPPYSSAVCAALRAVPKSYPQRDVPMSRKEGICCALRGSSFFSFQLLWDFHRISLNPLWFHRSLLTLISA